MLMGKKGFSGEGMTFVLFTGKSKKRILKTIIFWIGRHLKSLVFFLKRVRIILTTS